MGKLGSGTGPMTIACQMDNEDASLATMGVEFSGHRQQAIGPVPTVPFFIRLIR